MISLLLFDKWTNSLIFVFIDTLNRYWYILDDINDPDQLFWNYYFGNWISSLDADRVTQLRFYYLFMISITILLLWLEMTRICREVEGTRDVLSEDQ